MSYMFYWNWGELEEVQWHSLSCPLWDSWRARMHTYVYRQRLSFILLSRKEFWKRNILQMNINYSNGHHWVPALTWILCQITNKEKLVRHSVPCYGFRLIKATNINRYFVILIQDFELNWSCSPLGDLLQWFVVCCFWVIEPCLTLWPLGL